MSENLKRRRLVVELGPDGSPVGTRRGQNAIGPEDNYVCIDTFNGSDVERREAQKWLAVHRRLMDAKGNWAALRRDASELTFRNRTVDHVIAVNFFGEPSTWNKHRRIAGEIARVLKPTGIVTVVETIPPRFIGLEQVRALMRDHGLVQVSSGSEHDLSRIGQFANTPSSDQDAFIADFAFPEQGKAGESIPESGRAGNYTAPGGSVEHVNSVGDLVAGVGRVLSSLAVARNSCRRIRPSGRPGTPTYRKFDRRNHSR